MDVKAIWEKQEGNQGTLTIEVDADSFNKALDKAFNKVVKQVNVPGFRKGKVPRMIFEQRFGVESLYQEAVDFVLPEAYSKALDETKIEPVAQPSIDIETIGKGQALVVKAEVTVKPEVKLGDYKGLKVEAQETEVSAEDVNEEIKKLQERYAELAVKEEGSAELGDTVILDFEGSVDGEAFEGGKSENYSLELGSNQFIPGFEDQLVGIQAGEEKDIQVKFPEDYHAEELKGKEATFKVKVHEIKAKQLPELDDEFAKDVDEEAETLDALREKLENQLKEKKESSAKAATQDSLVEQVTANAEIDLPEVMVDSELDRMVREFEQQIQAQGLSMDLYYQFSGTDQNGLRDQMKEEAEKRVRANLTLEAIADTENLEASDADVDQEIENMAKMYGLAADQMRQMLDLQGGADALKGDLKIRKALDFLVDNSVVEATEA
ncbi:MAG TPA: trigger factor [Candidatus Angelobacter sp.]|nr:trigger factor [Candidatus Angelobacter sp.]